MSGIISGTPSIVIALENGGSVAHQLGHCPAVTCTFEDGSRDEGNRFRVIEFETTGATTLCQQCCGEDQQLVFLSGLDPRCVIHWFQSPRTHWPRHFAGQRSSSAQIRGDTASRTNTRKRMLFHTRISKLRTASGASPTALITISPSAGTDAAATGSATSASRTVASAAAVFVCCRRFAKEEPCRRHHRQAAQAERRRQQRIVTGQQHGFAPQWCIVGRTHQSDA